MSSMPAQPISPLDGRYHAAVSALGEHLSEAGLNRARVRVEVEWLLYLTDHELFGSHKLEPDQQRLLRAFAADFGQTEIDALATLESTTRHDVKAVEYLVRDKLAELGLTSVAELVHFACTSEDINNLAYALTIQAAVREVWMPKLRERHRRHPRARGRAPRPGDARAHARAAGDADHRRQGVRRVRLPAGPDRGPHRGRPGDRQVQRRHRNLRRPRRRGPEPGLADDLPRVRDLARAPVEPAHHADRVARLAGRALSGDVAREPRAPQPVHRPLGLHLDGLLPADPAARRHRLVDHAAQDQPDPVRERRGQSRDLERAARHPRRDAGHQPAPARPHRLLDPAQHRCRVRPFIARAGQHPARSRRDRSRPASGSPPTSTRTGRCSARPSRPSSVPR